MQAQHDNSSDEELSKYKKRGYEYVEEEKVVLDELVMLYRKRLELNQRYLKDLEELHATATANIDPTSSIYELLANPVLDCLQRDIEGYKRYAESAENDLNMVTISIGPTSIGQEIRRDMEAVKTLYPEYSNSCHAVALLPSCISTDEMWRTHEEDILHRQIAAKLHPKQKAARMHFEVTYPQLLEDHTAYMEQVGKLVQNNATSRSELSTTIACNASGEKNNVYKFSTTDAIAVPYMKMDLEKDRREYRHAPILNIVTRGLEEGHTVILGRDIDIEADDDIGQEVLTACLYRYSKTYADDLDEAISPVEDEGQGYPSNNPRNVPWSNYWDIIHLMEADASVQNIHDIVSKIMYGSELRILIFMIMRHTRMGHPLNIVSQPSRKKFQERFWERNRSLLANVMKDVNPKIQRIMKACAVADLFYFSLPELILLNEDGPIHVDRRGPGPIWIILRAWDFDLWRPLPEDVHWHHLFGNGDWYLGRRKYIQGKQYKDGWISLEVDENGNVLDTPENQQRADKARIEEQPQPKSRVAKLFHKLKH